MRVFAAILFAGIVWAQAPAKPVAKAPAAAPMPAVSSLKYAPLREVKIPEIAPFTLANGMRVYLLENHELPVVNGFALVRTGNLFDPKDKIGLATVTGQVMRTGGTQAKTGEQLNEQLENIAASVESSIGETSGRVGFNCLKENTAEVLAAFKDVLASPAFRQDKLDLAKMQQKSLISRRNDDADDIARREFTSILYGKTTPYGWDSEYATIDAIQRTDLVDFHKRYFFPKNIILAIYGDFDSAQMRSQLENLFADWKVEQPAVPEFPKVDRTPRPGLHFAEKGDVNQTTILFGHLGGELRDKDYPALDVMGSVLGGSPFTSRLGKAIRVERGYAYQVFGDWGANYTHPGLFQVVAGTKSENTVDAVRVMQSEIEKFRSGQPTEAELKSAKDKILNTFVFNFDSPAKTLTRIVNYEYFGYPKDFVFQYQRAVEKVTPADVARVAKEYLKPENFTYVLVGNPAELKTPLTALNMAVNKIDLTIPEPAKPAAKTDAGTQAEGKRLFARMQQAMGGAEKLAAVRDYSQTTEIELSTGQGTLKATQKQFWVAPSTFRQESQLPFGTIASYFDGKTGWFKGPQGEMPLGGPILKQVQDQLFRDLLSIARWTGEVNAVAPNTIEIKGPTSSTRIALDPATGLPKSQTYSAAGMGGPPTDVEEVYGSFRDVSGIQMPSSVTVSQGGKQSVAAKVTTMSINSGLKAEDLAKKP